jgi:ketosteroid isomerase-like protein
MTAESSRSPRDIVLSYFEMWNTGDGTAARRLLDERWIDHAHPEVVGASGVETAIQRARASQPDLRFQIDAVLGDDDLVAAVGRAGRGSTLDGHLIWLVRVEDGRMAEMWTYRR